MCAHPETDKQPGGIGMCVCTWRRIHAWEAEWTLSRGWAARTAMLIEVVCLQRKERGSARGCVCRKETECRFLPSFFYYPAPVLCKWTQCWKISITSFKIKQQRGQEMGGKKGDNNGFPGLPVITGHWGRTERSWRDNFTVGAKQPEPSSEKPNYETVALQQLIALTSTWNEERENHLPLVAHV